MTQLLIHNSARVLEFDALRELLRGYASSPLGQIRIEALAPSLDSDWIREQQGLAEEVREFRRVGGRFDFSSLIDVIHLIEKSRIRGAVLETTDIRDVVLVVDRAAEWREIALHPPANMRTDWRRMRTLSESVPDFTDFLRFFRNKIQPDGMLEDRASSELARIRREIEKQRRVIQESLRGYLRQPGRGRRGAGRTDHYPRRALRHPGKDRTEAARARRGAWREFQRANRIRRTAGND